MAHKIRCLIDDDYTRAAQKNIQKGSLKAYTTDGVYLYKELTEEEYNEAVKNGDNEPFVMDELNLEAEYVYNQK